MKKTSTRKLSLRTQTIRVLDPITLDRVVGGSLAPVGQGFIMKDSVIVPPRR